MTHSNSKGNGNGNTDIPPLLHVRAYHHQPRLSNQDLDRPVSGTRSDGQVEAHPGRTRLWSLIVHSRWSP